MSEETETRVVLRDDVTEEMVEDLADDERWVLLGSHPADERRPYERVWEAEGSGVHVFYVWDDLFRLAFILLRGRDVPAVEARIRSVLPTNTYEQVLEELRTATGRVPVIDAILRLAAHRRPEDPAAVELLRREAASGDADVRRAVVSAAGYLEWPALLRLAEDLRERDPDAAVRRDADVVLSAIGR